MTIPSDFLSTEETLERQSGTTLSSRVNALLKNTSKSIGASCNVFSVEDNMDSIGDSFAWANSVLAYQGAPSVDLSKLRPSGSKLGSGGTSSGAVSFGRIHDRIISQVRREEKKNGAGILYLDHNHAELVDFLEEPYTNAYKAVYLPMHDTPEAEELLKDTAKVELLTKAYNDFKCFLVKRPLPVDGEELFVNLCTEIEIPHKGFCILGAVNLSAVKEWSDLPSVFAHSMELLANVEHLSKAAADKTRFLGCDSRANKQVGLGVLGLASVLGANGITYQQFNEDLERVLAADYREDERTFAHWLVIAYKEAAAVAYSYGLRSAFCIQPTVSTSQRCLDKYGYNVSAEIQPVDGIKTDGGVRLLRKSAIKGDKVEHYHPGTWTIDEVPYSVYAKTSALFQQVFDYTELGHRHSHCFYGKEFTTEDFIDFYKGELRYRKSLYYRLNPTNNTSSLRKDVLWQSVEEGELFDGDLSFLPQQHGTIVCECQD
jgi:hypothetical protein